MTFAFYRRNMCGPTSRQTKATRLMQNVKGSDACRRLMTIPGVGVVTATALVSLRDRRPANVAVVAIANKTARIVWALLKFGGTYGHPGDGATMRAT